MTLRLKLFAIVLGACSLAGCSSSHPVSADGKPAADGKVHAECTVCAHNADLACLDVAVDGSTPRCGYQGKEYFFCSDECRQKFEKDPAKYAQK